jgi:phosphonate transport system permease protein
VLLAAFAALAGLAVYSFDRVGISLTALVDGYSDIRRLVDRMFPIRFDNFDRTVELAVETLFIAFLGTALAVVVSIPLAFLAARNTTMNGLAYGAVRAFIVAMRAIPDLVFALIFVRAIGIGGVGGIISGILAIGLHAVGMVGKLYADAIEQIDEGPRQAVVSSGATKTQSLVTGVMPQVLPAFIGVALYRLDINFRTSTILGYVGAGGIGQLLQLYLSGLRYDRALGVTVVIVALVLAVEFLSAAARRGILGADPYEQRRLSRRVLAAGHKATSRVLRAGGTEPGPGGARSPGAEAAAGGDGAPPGALAFDRDKVRPPWTPQRRRAYSFGGLGLAMLVASFAFTGVTPLDLVTSLGDIGQVAVRLVPGDMSWYTGRIGSAMIETLAIGLAASCIGLVLSLPLAFLAASNVAPGRAVYYAARSVVVAIRAVPELILAVIFVAALSLGPSPGVMALSIGTLGFATKLFADSIEEVRQGPRDAIAATGATRIQESSTGVVPQVMPALVGTSLYVLDINIRASTIVGIVGAGGIGFYLIQAIRTLEWETVGGIMAMIFIVVYGIERLSGWMRAQLL